VQKIHDELTLDFAESTDPIFPPGVKSQPLLESAVGRPHTGYGNESKYPTVESAGAALLHSLVQNHPFHNGNKRSALVSMLVFLDRHNFVLESTEEELFRFMIRVAAHDLLPPGFLYDNVPDREVAEISLWISRHSRVIRREERALTWRALARILRQRNCDIAAHGEKITISRDIPIRRRLFGGERTIRAESHYINTGDGREVPRSVLKRIRQELRFDAEHGVDSEMFYGGHQDPDFFILEYSKLLKRLARV
jgi:death-on-curing protein